jgi:glycosyltransferase involved in cell wall biosynthesis
MGKNYLHMENSPVSAAYDPAERNAVSFPSGIAVILPALDPDGRLPELLRALRSMGAEQILVINDGSGESWSPLFSRLHELFGVIVLHHPDNRGKGAALKTGMRYLLANLPDCLGCVTADADGQHTPEDIARVALRLSEGGERLILGTREFSGEDVPPKSRAGNRITSAVFRLQTGRRCADTQTGLRGIPATLLPQLVDIPGERYEYEMNMLLYAADNDIPFFAVPIQTVYIDENRKSHFRAVRDSVRVYSGILKFGAASLICALVDIGLFTLLAATAFRGSDKAALYAAIAARLCSGVLNYSLNKFAVFGQRGGAKQSAEKYFLLFVCIMAISAGATQVLSALPVPLTIMKILVDAALFCMSYAAQRRFVFAKSFRPRGKERCAVK